MREEREVGEGGRRREGIIGREGRGGGRRKRVVGLGVCVTVKKEIKKERHRQTDRQID